MVTVTLSCVAGTHEIGVETTSHADSNGLSLDPSAVYNTSVGRGGAVADVFACRTARGTDGAAAVVICNDAGLKKIQSNPRAEIVSISVVGDDPVFMLTGPIPASKKALETANLSIDDMDLYEVNEAFAPVPLAWADDLKADKSKLNVNGGAMALGHPLGATGAKLMTTLLHEMERRESTYGLQAICEGGGTANATIIKRL